MPDGSLTVVGKLLLLPLVVEVSAATAVAIAVVGVKVTNKGAAKMLTAAVMMTAMRIGSCLRRVYIQDNDSLLLPWLLLLQSTWLNESCCAFVSKFFSALLGTVQNKWSVVCR